MYNLPYNTELDRRINHMNSRQLSRIPVMAGGAVQAIIYLIDIISLTKADFQKIPRLYPERNLGCR